MKRNAQAQGAELQAFARPDSVARAKQCPSCAEWNAPQMPFRIFGSTWYVGTHGLGALLLTSEQGHVLIDGGLPESAPIIAANIRTLGFRLEDVKIIVNSHHHYDHAGGLAELQKLSGAQVFATPSSARAMRIGKSEKDDPQFGVDLQYPPVKNVRTFRDGETLRAGTVTLAAHITAGHTPGGTTWAWDACEAQRCLHLVYADSQTPVSADNFYFTRSPSYPNVLRDFEHSFTVLEQLPCDILVTPHPDASGFWQRVARRAAGERDALVDTAACGNYAASARKRLAARVAAENSKR